MGVSDEAKNVIPLKFLRKIKNKNFFPLVNSIRGHTVYLNIQAGPDITCQKNSGSLEGSSKSKKPLFIRSKIMGIN
jgi:hypothetical protein